MNNVLFALLGGIFTWGVTTAGSAFVFMFKKTDSRIIDVMISVSAGIMLAASFWSLLYPAKEQAKSASPIIWGFICGCLFLFATDRLIKLFSGKKNKTLLSVLAITMHNIPEGMAFGVAFGAAGSDSAALSAAIALTIGIGIQNFPEGAAVSIPVRSMGKSRFKAFMTGQLSALVEPAAAVVGAVLVGTAAQLLPFMLAFAAGAMIWVSAGEMIPELHSENAVVGVMSGFIIMTVLDILI